MKKLNLLSKAEMKKVLGGYIPEGGGEGGEFGTCKVTVKCFTGTVIECSGSNGKCKHQDDNLSHFGWVQCDNDAKVSCKNGGAE